jgi:hypothetical protein
MPYKPLGGKSEVEPPVPIPNTEVKRLSAHDTEEAAPCGKYATAKRLLPFLERICLTFESPMTYNYL